MVKKRVELVEFITEVKPELKDSYKVRRGPSSGSDVTGKALAVLKNEMRSKGWVVGADFEKLIKKGGLKIVKASCITQGQMTKSKKKFERLGKTCLVVTA